MELDALSDVPENPIITLSGNESYVLNDAVNFPLWGLNIYGKSVQGGGAPTPDAPVDIVSVGDDGAVEVAACGKNLLQIIPEYSRTHKGVTVTSKVDNNGLYCIEIKGTSTTNYIDFRPFGGDATTKALNLPDGDYILSGIQPNSGLRLVALCRNDQNPQIDIGNGVKLTQGDNDYYYIRLDVQSEGDFDTVIYPMLRLASITDSTYEPYKGNTATITSGLPLCSVGDYRDELIYNADGTGKIIKRTAKLDSYNGEVITTDYISSTGGLDTGAKVVYVLENPIEIELSAAEMVELGQLQTFDGTTNIWNDENAEMTIKYLRKGDFVENKEIYYIEESQSWTCPMAGRWKVIAVGGGASGGGAAYANSALTTYLPTAGGTTSFGNVISANGGVATTEIASGSGLGYIGGYGGYNGFTYGGAPSSRQTNEDNITFSPAGGNNTMAYLNVSHSTPTAALGWGAGGGALTSAGSSPGIGHYVIPGRAGDIRTTIVSIDEGEIIPCTVGAGGVAAEAEGFKFANGADGVIILQYLGA